MRTIRGATTITEDSATKIEEAVQELLTVILQKNKIKKTDIQSILISTTADIQAAYPAKFIRLFGFTHASLFSVTEPNIQGSLPYCIRLLLFVNRPTHIKAQIQGIVTELHTASFLQNAQETNRLLQDLQDRLSLLQLEEQEKQENFQNTRQESVDIEVQHIYLHGAKFLRPDVNIVNIAIDGPAGSGKSSLAKLLAEKIGIYYLDTGAMYRATTFYLRSLGVNIYDQSAVANAVENFPLVVEYQDRKQLLFVNGENLTEYIRTPEIAMDTAIVAQNAAVRKKLIAMQREIAQKCSCVVDGRDIGYNVLPKAEYKFFLTAEPEIRARRRMAELTAKGENVLFETILKDIELRDKQDIEREIAPLKKAEDAILIDTSEYSLQEVLEQVLQHILQ